MTELLSKVQLLFTISRPRFWLYSLGPALLGAVSAAPSWATVLNPATVLLFFYFLIPANIWIYGVNDWFDSDTDIHNQKKRDRESLLLSPGRITLLKGLIFFLSCTVTLFWILPSRVDFWLWLFVLLAWLYSAPPVRFKTRPYFDCYSNVLYIMPFFVTANLFGSDRFNPWLFILAGLWTAGMHVFSALPDITPDTKAGITTTATVLKYHRGLLFVGGHWLAMSVASCIIWGWPAIPLLIYPGVIAVMLYRFAQKPYTSASMEHKISKVYWLFPYINALIGLYLFWALAVSRFGLEQILKPLTPLFS